MKAAKHDERLVQKILNQDLLDHTLPIGRRQQTKSLNPEKQQTRSLDHKAMKNLLFSQERKQEGKTSMNEKIKLFCSKKQEKANLAATTIRLLKRKNKNK